MFFLIPLIVLPKLLWNDVHAELNNGLLGYGYYGNQWMNDIIPAKIIHYTNIDFAQFKKKLNIKIYISSK